MNDMADQITGGCLCGAVRYRASGAPVAARICYCRTCQYIAAGNGSVNAVFRAADVSFTGEMREYVSTADSGNVMHRRFCPVCGTPVSAQGEARPDILVLRAGTMDDPNAVKPDGAIWVASAPRWVCFDPQMRQVARQPAPLPK